MQPKANNEIKPKSNIYTRIKSKHFRLGISLLLPRQCFLTSSKSLLNVKKFPLETHSAKRIGERFVGRSCQTISGCFTLYCSVRVYPISHFEDDIAVRYYSVWSMCGVCTVFAGRSGGISCSSNLVKPETNCENNSRLEQNWTLLGHYLHYF